MTDMLTIIERAYSPAENTRAWLMPVVEAVQACWGGQLPFVGYRFTMRPAVDPTSYDPIDYDSTVGVGLDLSPITAAMRVAPIEMRFLLEGTNITTLSAILAQRTPREQRVINDYRQAAIGRSDLVGMTAYNPDHTGVVVFGILPDDQPLSALAQRLWRSVAAHLSAGARLRRALIGNVRDDVLGTGEAVMSPDGRLSHAEAAAQGPKARERLKQAVVSVERARTAPQRVNAKESLALWKALVAGRWSLIERYDTDGRRCYIAHENSPIVRPHRALTAREQQVVAYAVQGLSQKEVAYHLGLDRSTVASHLARARRKLGVASQMELIDLAGTMGLK